MNTIRLFLLSIVLTLTVSAAEPPPVRKADAKRILELMEWKEVTIITVQQGVNSKGQAAPIFANIVAFGLRDARHQTINQTLYYDEDYGWFYFEMTEKFARVWTKERYQEVRPWTTW